MSTNVRRCAAIVTAVASLAVSACSASDPGALPASYHPPLGGRADASVTPDASPDPTPSGSADSGAGAIDSGNIDASTPDASDASDAPSGPAVLSLTLIDTSVTNVIQGSPVAGYDPLKNNSTFSLGTVGTNLSIRANVTPTGIASVLFAYDGTNHTENATPWTLCGDDGAGTITNCNIAAGQHTLTVTPYSAANLGGTAGVPLTIAFTVNP